MSHLVLHSTDSFLWLIHSETRQVTLYEWVTESLTHLIHSKTWIHSVTIHRCVAQRSSVVTLIGTIFVNEIEPKKVNIVLILTSCLMIYYCIKSVSYCSDIHGNILVLQCCVPKSYIIIFFLLPQYASITFCVRGCAHLFCFLHESLSHTHSGGACLI